MKKCPYCKLIYNNQENICPQDNAVLVFIPKEKNLLDKYQLLKELGQGGMGVVYEALHNNLNRKVAIKFLSSETSQNNTVQKRFEREAKILASIDCLNIVQVHDFDKDNEGTYFIVMEYLEGSTLRKILNQQHLLELNRIIDIFYQLSTALGAVHNKSIIHRDLKPENIFIIKKDDHEVVKVLDFGISKFGHSSSSFTKEGAIIGTLCYLSPEQASGTNEVTVQSDIYSLGAMLYECATGKTPVSGETPLEIVSNILTAEPQKPSDVNPDISDKLEAIILKAMDKNLVRRYKSCDEIADDLLKLKNGSIDTQEKPAKLSEEVVFNLSKQPYKKSRLRHSESGEINKVSSSIKYLIAAIILITIGALLLQIKTEFFYKSHKTEIPLKIGKTDNIEKVPVKNEWATLSEISKKTSIILSQFPAGAQVLYDAAVFYQNPLFIIPDKKIHTLKVIANGYIPFIKQIDPSSSSTLSIDVKLTPFFEKIDPSQQSYRDAICCSKTNLITPQSSLDLACSKADDEKLINEFLLNSVINELNLCGTSVTDKGMVNIFQKAVNINKLDLRFVKTTISTIKTIAQNLSQLTILNLSGTTFDDESAQFLSKLKNLEYIDVSYTIITDFTLREIAEIKTLKTVVLSGCNITSSGIMLLKNLSNLEILNLSETSVTNQILKTIVVMPKLKKLNLNRTAIDDQSIAELVKLKSLVELDIEETLITEEGIDNLKQQMPYVEIRYSPYLPDRKARTISESL